MARTRLINKEGEKVRVVTINDLIDKYGDLDAQIKELENQKKELREKLVSELGLGNHQGNRYNISISEQQTIVLNPIKVAKRVGSKAFMQIVTVPVEKARLFLSAQDIEECIKERKATTRVTVKKK